MSCGKIEIYKKKDWADDFAFVFIRQMYWSCWDVACEWSADSWSAEAFLIPIGLISSGHQWSKGQTVGPYVQSAYPNLATALDGEDGACAPGAPPLDLKPGYKPGIACANPVPYTMAQLWVWTDQGWCLQASRRNW